MDTFKSIPDGQKVLYQDNAFSGDYSQSVYIKKSADDGSKKPKYYINVYSHQNGVLRLQGFLYFYLDYEAKKSYFIGLEVYPEFRNLNIASFLVATWIDLCLNNGYEFLSTHEKQGKPFLLYLLKTYGFEILDKSLYQTRPEIISVCCSKDKLDLKKYLAFKTPNHERDFIQTNFYKQDNYHVIHNMEGFFHLDDIIMPIKNARKKAVNYLLLEEDIAQKRVEHTIGKHTK